MKTLTPGHRYELDNLEGAEPQVLQFIQKESVSEGSTELVTIVDGTTNEEVLDVLIDRIGFLNDRVPSEINDKVLTCLQQARTLLEQRTAERKERGVEGTNAE